MENVNTSNQHVVEACLPTITTTPYQDLDGGFAASEFRRIMLESVDETFSSLGKKAKQSVYLQLENTFGIARIGIPIEIDKFAGALEKVFGPGAKLLEIEIMKRLHRKVGLEIKYCPKSRNLIFTEYIEATRALLFVSASTKKPMPNEYYDYKFC